MQFERICKRISNNYNRLKYIEDVWRKYHANILNSDIIRTKITQGYRLLEIEQTRVPASVYAKQA